MKSVPYLLLTIGYWQLGVSTHLVGDAVVVSVGVAFVAHLVVVGVGLRKEKRHLVLPLRSASS